MIPVDTDYSAYVIGAYVVAAAGLVSLLVWSLLRVAAAQRKLAEAEKDETQ